MTINEQRLCACGCGETLHPHANGRAKYRNGHRERHRSRADVCQCGQPKSRRRGARYCDDCRSTMTAAARARADEATAARADERRRADGVRRRPKPDDPTRTCTRCLGTFTKDEMKPDPRKASGVSSHCKTCAPIVQHEYQIRHSFGIEPEDYYGMLADQGGVCAICGKAPRKQRLAVDHNHKTGEIRGLLCMRCNHKVLGGSGEDVGVLRNAAAYLEHPPARHRGHLTPEITVTEIDNHFRELAHEIDNAKADTGVLVVKRRGIGDAGQWYAITPLYDWAANMKLAGR